MSLSRTATISIPTKTIYLSEADMEPTLTMVEAFIESFRYGGIIVLIVVGYILPFALAFGLGYFLYRWVRSWRFKAWLDRVNEKMARKDV